jgi:hypothetical protein
LGGHIGGSILPFRHGGHVPAYGAVIHRSMGGVAVADAAPRRHTRKRRSHKK